MFKVDTIRNKPHHTNFQASVCTKITPQNFTHKILLNIGYVYVKQKFSDFIMQSSTIIWIRRLAISENIPRFCKTCKLLQVFVPKLSTSREEERKCQAMCLRLAHCISIPTTHVSPTFHHCTFFPFFTLKPHYLTFESKKHISLSCSAYWIL